MGHHGPFWSPGTRRASACPRCDTLVHHDGTICGATFCAALLFVACLSPPAPAQVPILQDVHRMFPHDGVDTDGLALGDLDGDQDLDAFLGNAATNSCSAGGGGGCEELFRNDGSGGLEAIPFPTGPCPDTSAVLLGDVDVDGDGDLDVLTGNGGWTFAWPYRQNRLYVNDGTGSFVEVTGQLPPDNAGTRALALGDVDGDGDPDVLAGNGASVSGGELNALYLNDGAGSLVLASGNLPPHADPTAAVALGDVDGDGDLDAWIGIDAPSLGSGQDHLLRNLGPAHFVNDAASIPYLPDPTMAVVLGDVDGDGDLDALLGNLGPYGSNWPARLALNQGTGIFLQASNGNLPDHPISCYDLAMGDVDGDGDLDAWFATQGQDLLYVNDGAGIFSIGTGQIPPQTASTVAVSLGDVDGDQDLDAWTAQPSIHVLYRNAGGGVFQTSPSSIPASLTSTSDAALADVDGDLDLDAYLGGGSLWYPKPNQLALNDGTGIFSDASSRVPQDLEPASAVALADLDGDGDPDAVIGCTNQQDRFHRNLSRQLSWRHLPRLGKPLLLDIHGPAAGPYVLLLSPAPGATSTPYGTLWLSSAGLLVAGTGTLDGQGQSLYTLPLVPSQPGLAGLSIYWQAFVGLPLGLTNLEITTFTLF